MMLKERYFIKIVPHRGSAIHRFELTRRHIFSAAGAIAVFLLGAFALHAFQLHAAHSQLQALQTLTASQRDELQNIDQQTTKLKSQLQTVQSENRQIQRLIGARTNKLQPQRDRRSKLSRVHPASAFFGEAAGVERTLSDLSVASERTSREAATLKHLTLRILNLRHLESVQRDLMVAAIPSIDPVDGAPVVGCFCYRTSPDVGFHEGIDLGADYGQTVRAAAAGTIVSNSYDGGFGIKVDIDHGNGYHTWYAHLSKTNVVPGERVTKGQPIASVGSTGFSTGPHLHYQVMLNGSPTDPTPYLGRIPANVLAALP